MYIFPFLPYQGIREGIGPQKVNCIHKMACNTRTINSTKETEGKDRELSKYSGSLLTDAVKI